MSDMIAPLTHVERFALSLGRYTNERPLPKRLQLTFLKTVSYAWVYPAIAPRVYTENMDWLAHSAPNRGVVLVANHRSFFDMYVILLSLFRRKARWVKKLYFPVRSNFFYEQPLGIAINMLIGGGAMYPPIFRDAAKSELNKDAIRRVIGVLDEPGTLVGLHPEGTRGKGPDPYELLPAQPGVGQIVLHARPKLVPIFINGLPNDVRKSMLDTYRKQARRHHPIIIVVGDELDYSEFTSKKPRVALYKRCADKMTKAIAQLGERERQIRAACSRDEVPDSDPNWLIQRHD